MSTHLQARNFWGYITPYLSIVLALPTALTCLAFWGIVGYEVSIKDFQGTLFLAIVNWQPSLLGWFALYILLGPIFACVLCAGQLARWQTASDLPGGHPQRLTKAVLIFAVISICLLILTGTIARIVQGPT